VFFISLSHAESPPPEIPSSSAAESLAKSYVDQDFINEELPPPQQCEQYSEKLMFSYDWNVVIQKIGPYDSARKLLPVAATIVVRCGPFQAQPHPPGEAASSEFPLRSETPIDFQMVVDPENAQQWKIQEATLWKSKQKVIQK
jgi:hypothetical protein